MMRDRSKFPPGGWQYIHPGTGWVAPNHLSLTQLARKVVSYRQNNPQLQASTDLSTVMDEIDTYNCNRIGWDDQWCSGGEKKTSVAPPHQRSGVVNRLQGHVVKAVNHVAGSIRGSAALIEWLGEGGKPVSQSVADERARTCSTCPKNSSTWNFRSTIAQAIKRHSEVKHSLSLKTGLDDKLGTCTACECPLKLKIWVPLAHITNHMTSSVEADLHPDCWITAEKKSSRFALASP